MECLEKFIVLGLQSLNAFILAFVGERPVTQILIDRH